MAANSNIEWTEHTWNPVVGCTPVSPGCLNCYAATMARRLEAMGQTPYVGLTVKKGERAVFNGTVRTLGEKLTQPLTWRKPRRVFVNSMSDLFHKDVPFEFIDKVFAVMALTPQHTYQILTKRPERMAEYLCSGGGRRNIDVYNAAAELIACDWSKMPCDMAHTRSSGGNWWPLRNVCLGTSVENQPTADERVPELLKCPAVVRFLSVEPLLARVDLNIVGDGLDANATEASSWSSGIQWVIVGGESGPNSRPCDVQWIRGVVQQCKAARVPVFVKQLGAKPVASDSDAAAWWKQVPKIQYTGTGTGGMYVHLTHSKGGDPSEWPEDLRVREMPEVAHD